MQYICPGCTWARNEILRVGVFGHAGIMFLLVGRDEQVVREYIRNQEAEERRIDQLDLLR